MAGYVEDTIAAIATAAGPGAISILRISGRQAREVARRILRSARTGRPVRLPAESSHRAAVARLVTPDGETPIDDVLVLPMWAPRSYTGEDTVEIHCHGGRAISDLALRASLAAGARAARAGEFTERAFLNGRLDLCQAEAVADMISARSEAALVAAQRQLGGELSRAIETVRDGILDARALVEAHLDFPEEDLPPGVEAELQETIGQSVGALVRLEGSYARGRLVRDGAAVAIVGKPNVGKSSLLNALLGRERALVSPHAGTTRDYLEEPVSIGSLEVLLCDTAGIRNATGALEQAGIQRSRERIESADVLILVLDGSSPIEEADRHLYEQVRERALVLARNKCDLPPAWERPGAAFDDRACIPVSAAHGQGLRELEHAILAALPQDPEPSEGPIVTNARHHQALGASLGHLREAGSLLDTDRELELVAVELQLACTALDEVLGRTDDEAILDRIFSRFCVGK